MIRNKLNRIKCNLKKNAPAIVAIVSTLTTVSVIVYYKTRTELVATKKELAMLKAEENLAFTYTIDGSDYSLDYWRETPEH